VSFLILGHVEADYIILIVEEKFGQSPAKLGFADPGGTQKNRGGFLDKRELLIRFSRGTACRAPTL